MWVASILTVLLAVAGVAVWWMVLQFERYLNKERRKIMGNMNSVKERFHELKDENDALLVENRALRELVSAHESSLQMVLQELKDSRPVKAELNAREHVLHLVRQERTRQIAMYGHNRDLALGFGGSVALPWLSPFSSATSSSVERVFREDYEAYVAVHGKPSWMHLIREEVAELFDSMTEDSDSDPVTEAVQVAALCVSLVEFILQRKEWIK